MACTQTYITADDDRKKGVRHALISRLVEMTGPLVYTVMPVSGDNSLGECSFGKGVRSLVRFSASENLCTRRVLRPVSAAACQTRKKSVDFALSTEKARACTQTYITAADDRKKGVRHALISRLVEMTGLAPVYSYGQKDFSTYLALIDNVGTKVYQANPVVPESVMPFFPPDERKNRSLLKHAEYKSAELFTSTAATRLQRARNY